MAISAAACYFAVASEASLVALLLGAYGGVAQIFPLVFGAFYGLQATRAGTLAGIAVSTPFLAWPELRLM